MFLHMNFDYLKHTLIEYIFRVTLWHIEWLKLLPIFKKYFDKLDADGKQSTIEAIPLEIPSYISP